MSASIVPSASRSDGWQPGDHLMVSSEGLRYHVVASGQGPVVVLVAGFPQTCYAWRRVAPLLAGDFTVLAVDLPGQGDSLADIEIHAGLMTSPIEVPLLALTADAGSTPDRYERLRPLGRDVRGGLIADSGHYIPEEQPAALAARLREFIISLPPQDS